MSAVEFWRVATRVPFSADSVMDRLVIEDYSTKAEALVAADALVDAGKRVEVYPVMVWPADGPEACEVAAVAPAEVEMGRNAIDVVLGRNGSIQGGAA